MSRRVFSIALALVFFVFASPRLAEAGPSFEDLSIADINEMLESSRAKSKSDVKALMEIGLVAPGGSAKSGLVAVTLHELKDPPGYFGGFSRDSSTFVLGNRKYIAWWDVKTLGLKRVVLVESKRHFIFGASDDGSRIVIGKGELDGTKSEFEFAVHDGTTLKKLRELGYNKGSQEEIFGNFAQPGVMSFDMSPDGRWFILGHSKGPLQVWDAASGKLVHENYNYNNKPKGNGMVFSGDSRFVAIKHGGKQVLYSLAPFKQVRELSDQVVALSSTGKYLAYRGNRLENMTGGVVCDSGTGMVGSGFTIDDAFWLVSYRNGVGFKPTGAKDCPELNVVMYPAGMKSKKFLLRITPAPDGKHFAVSSHSPPPSGNKLVGKLRIFEWAMPKKETAEVLIKAERGLNLYGGGLKKQGEAMLASVIKTDSALLWDRDFEDRLAKTRAPLYLVGTLYLNASRDISHMQTYIRCQYAIVACQAKQPFLAATALAEVNKAYKEGRTPSARELAMYTGANALSMMVAGRTDDAYTTLIESGIGKDLVPVLKRYPDAFAPLLKEPVKLALALDIDQSLLPKPGREGQPQNYVDLAGNLVRVTPPATPTVNRPQTTPARQPAKKKKSSVILD